MSGQWWIISTQIVITPLSCLVSSFTHSFIYCLRNSSDNFKLSLFYVCGFCRLENPSGSAQETRSTILKPVPIKQILAVLSVDPEPRHHLRVRHDGCLCEILCPCTGGNAWRSGIGAQVSLFSLSQNISRVEKRNKDDWQSWAKSHQLPCWQPGDVHTLLMCRRVTADWQHSTGRQGRWSLLRTPDTCCLCSALNPGVATLTRSPARHAGRKPVGQRELEMTALSPRALKASPL